MIKRYGEIIDELSYDYSNPKAKLQRMVKENEYYYIGKGVYATENDIPKYCFAQYIYSPSYISFDYALSKYGIIPEGVYTVTSATCNTRKTRNFNTSRGWFSYRDVPEKVFDKGILVHKAGDYSYKIAAPEKAVCDKLYTISPLRSVKAMRSLVFDDLRFDEFELENLDVELLEDIAEDYHSTNVNTFLKMLRRYLNE